MFVLYLKSSGKLNKLLLGNIYRNPHSTLENDKKLYALFDHIEQNFKIQKLIVGDFNFSNFVWYRTPFMALGLASFAHH